MQIVSRCPNCGFVHRLGAEWADRRKRCGRCWYMFKVPAMDELERPVRIIENSQGEIYVDEDGNLYG